MEPRVVALPAATVVGWLRCRAHTRPTRVPLYSRVLYPRRPVDACVFIYPPPACAHERDYRTHAAACRLLERCAIILFSFCFGKSVVALLNFYSMKNRKRWFGFSVICSIKKDPTFVKVSLRILFTQCVGIKEIDSIIHVSALVSINQYNSSTCSFGLFQIPTGTSESNQALQCN